MARYEDHILQVNRNLHFLASINGVVSDCYDWQVTVCFYSALHLVNAHLSKYGLQYRKHKDVNYAVNFENRTSPARLPEDQYLAYMALQSLSRRSRYLVNEKDRQGSDAIAHFTYDKHVVRSLRHLNRLLEYFEALYQTGVNPIAVVCDELKPGELRYFMKT